MSNVIDLQIRMKTRIIVIIDNNVSSHCYHFAKFYRLEQVILTTNLSFLTSVSRHGNNSTHWQQLNTNRNDLFTYRYNGCSSNLFNQIVSIIIQQLAIVEVIALRHAYY